MASNDITAVLWSKGENPKEAWNRDEFLTKMEIDSDTIKLWSKDPDQEHKVPMLRASLTERVELLMALEAG